MSIESFRTIELDPKSDSLPDETVASWLENTLCESGRDADIKLRDLNIDHNHPAFHDLAYLFNKEAKQPLSVRELWNRIRRSRKTVKCVREAVDSLLKVTPAQSSEQ